MNSRIGVAELSANMKVSKGALTRLLRRMAPNLFEPSLGTRPWGDLSGALSGALTSIPLTIAYGLIIGGALGGSLGGIGVLIALYSAVLVGLTAAVLGGCPFLVVATRAPTLLVFSALISHMSHSAALAHLPDPAAVALALACAAVFGSGVLQLIFGAFRLGQLANYVPLPVIAGFVNGTALLIIFSQAWPAMGLAAPRSLLALFTHAQEIKPASLLLALATAASVILLPRLKKRLPALLLAFVAGTAAYHLLAAIGFGAALGGTLPPPPDHFALRFVGSDAYAVLFGPFGGDLIRPILVAAVSMAILSSLDALLATSAVDGMTMRRSNPGRQLMAEGLGNALAGMFGMPLGSARVANTQAAFNGGMASAAAPIGIAMMTLVVAVALGPLVGMLPKAVMAGLLIALGIEFVDKWTLAQLRRLFSRGKRSAAAVGDLLVVAVVVVTTLLADLATAVGVGVLLSLLSFVMHMARSPIRRCYRATALIPRIYGDIARRGFIERHGRNIAVIEIEGALFFGTASELEERVEALATDGALHVVIDLRRVKHIDATGARALERINSKLTLRGGMLAVSHVDRERRENKGQFVANDNRKQFVSRNNWVKLAHLGTIAALGEEKFLRDTDGAVALCERHLATRLSSASEAHELPAFHSPLTRILDGPMLRRLRGYWNRIDYAPGDVAFAQGSDPDGVFLVASGRVEVLIDLPGTERKRKVQSLTSGSIFGEMALIDPMPRSASIVAVEPTTCYWVSSGNFERLKVEQTDIAFALLTDVAMIFAQRLRATNAMLAEMEA